MYAKALGASAQLAYRIALNAKFKKDEKRQMTINDLKKNLKRAKNFDVTELNFPADFQTLFQRINSGIQEAYKLSVQEAKQDESKNLPDWLETFNDLKFENLEAILKQLN